MEGNDLPKKAEGPYPPYLISLLTEFFGTAILMYIGCMGCVDAFNIGPVIPAFAFGMAVTSSIQIFGHISPCHINPAVTLGDLILGHIDLKRALVYVLGQYLGSIAGYGLLMALMPWNDQMVCMLGLPRYMTPAKGFALEVGIASVLMFAVAGVSDEANAPYQDSVSLKIGMIVAGLVFAAGPHTGACLNPARSVAPNIFYNYWKLQWLYHLAPYVGAAIGALLYRFIFSSKEKYSLLNFIKRRFPWCI